MVSVVSWNSETGTRSSARSWSVVRWRFRIEAADRFERVAEEIEPHRLGHARRIQIEDAAAHGVFAGLAHGRGAQKPLSSSQRGMPSIASMLPGAADSDCPATKSARRHALEDGVDGGEQDRRAARGP